MLDVTYAKLVTNKIKYYPLLLDINMNMLFYVFDFFSEEKKRCDTLTQQKLVVSIQQ